MNEKTMIKDPKTGAWTRVWTHHNVRKAYNMSSPGFCGDLFRPLPFVLLCVGFLLVVV